MLDEIDANIEIKRGEEKLLEVKKYLFFKDKEEEIINLEKKTLEPNFWDNRKTAEKILKKLKILKDKIENFEKLEKGITEKIKACLNKQERSQKIVESPLKESEGLQPFEATLLGVIIGEQITDEEGVSAYSLRENMMQLGFNKVAASIGIRSLKQKSLIETLIASDWNGNEYEACKLTKRGIDFILSHMDLFDLSPAKYEMNKKVSSLNLEMPF